MTERELTDEEVRRVFEAFLKWLEPLFTEIIHFNEAFEKWLMDFMEIYDKYIKEKEAERV